MKTKASARAAVLGPVYRAQVERFFDHVECDLYEAEKLEHIALCTQLANAAKQRGEHERARQIMARCQQWVNKLNKAYAKELGIFDGRRPVAFEGLHYKPRKTVGAEANRSGQSNTATHGTTAGGKRGRGAGKAKREVK